MIWTAKMRQFFADTFALIVFSTVAGITVEFFIVGLTPSQVFQARLAAIPVIVVTARPYGIYRDWLFALFDAPTGNRAKKTAVDISAFVTFQVPIYSATLALAGATIMQIVTSVGSAIIVLTASGRPYGLFLEWSRKLFGVYKNA